MITVNGLADVCDFPLGFDTYSGCSHDCKYCYARGSKKDGKINTKIKKSGAPALLREFIEGKRTLDTSFIDPDWKLPLRWGTLSDAFQPIESELRNSYECLKVFAETKYPFIVTTKGALIARDDYLELLKQCNCIIQISAACKEYDRLEPGASKFADKVAAMAKLSPHVRVMVRITPYIMDFHRQIKNSIKLFADAGVYGINCEGLRYKKPHNGRGFYNSRTYDYHELMDKFLDLKQEVHRQGIKFHCSEAYMRHIGDSLTCCGSEGLSAFKPQRYNAVHLTFDKEKPTPSEAMCKCGSSFCLVSNVRRSAAKLNAQSESFVTAMAREVQSYRDALGL